MINEGVSAVLTYKKEDDWCLENIIADTPNYDAIFVSIADKWRSYADIEDVVEKRKKRFDLLCRLQYIFTSYDFEMVKNIIETIIRQVHGVEYEYIIPKSIRSMIDNIGVVCKTHGVNEMRLLDHLLSPVNLQYPKGCGVCQFEFKSRAGRKFNTAVFIAKAELVHGSKYDYRFVEYFVTMEKISVICVSCRNDIDKGIFHPRAKHHLLGKNCPRCQILLTRDTFEEAVVKSQKIHGNDIYDYITILPPDTIGKGQRLVYLCNKCDTENIQLVNMHTSGKCGCRVCGRKRTGELNEVPFDEIVRRAREVRGDNCEYLGFVYDRSGKKHRKLIEYICPNCGIKVQQRVEAHLNGYGCDNCCKRGPDMSNVLYPILFYFIKLNLNDEFDTNKVYKVGYTTRDIGSRFKGELPNGVTYEIIYIKQFEPGGIAYKLEQAILQKFRKQYQYRGDFKLNKAGSGELFVAESVDEILSFINDYTSNDKV